MNYKNNILKGIAVGSIVLTASCSKDYLDTKPTEYIDEGAVTETMQKDPSQVQAYVTGAYLNFYCGGDYWTSHDDFGFPAIELMTDLWCEDVAYYKDAHYFCWDYQLDNRLGEYRRTSSTWNQLYNVIDNTNTIITMLKPAEGEEPSADAQIMLGEAYSLRAYCYFWLVNLWQHPYSVAADSAGVPLKTEEVYRQERVSVKEIYSQILSDIQSGYGYLEGKGFHNGKGSLSEYAAAAIYANVLMFTGDYENAAKYAKIAAESASLNSNSDMLSGFNSLSMPEVIWGYNVTNETTGYYASLPSHIDSYMPGYAGIGYQKLIASDLYGKIADNDIRKQWFGYNENYDLLENDFGFYEQAGMLPYIQNKFRDSYLTGTGDPFTSAMIYFRSGEMYFVAAEAFYLNNDETAARTMLNKVMETRIPGYSCNDKSGDELYKEICLQKRIDTWLEGDRYLDAKRRNETIDRSTSTNHAVDLAYTNAVTYSARDYRMIFRIPAKEIQNNPYITAEDDNK